VESSCLEINLKIDVKIVAAVQGKLAYRVSDRPTLSFLFIHLELKFLASYFSCFGLITTGRE